MGRWIGILARGAGLGLLAAAAGCGSSTGGAGGARHDPHPLPPDTMTVAVAEIGRYGGSFVIAQTTGPKTFNGMMANETSSSDITERMFEGLAYYDNATQLTGPLIARSWDVSPDGLTWTWHLRRGARFSDGHSITAEDVLFSFEVAYDSTLHPSIQDLVKVDGRPFEISSPDSYTVVTKIAAPYALMVPAVGAVKIMPKHVLEPAFRAGRFAAAYSVTTAPDSIVTSGAWRVKQHVAGEKTVLTANPWWFGVDPAGHRLPYLDELIYVVVADQDAADLKFRAGEVDGVDNVKAENYAWYEEHQREGDYTLHDLGPSLTSSFFWFNLNRVREPRPGRRVGEPQVDATAYRWFANRDFRRAVSMAIDRDAMIKGVYFGDAEKNWSTLTAGSRNWHRDDAKRFDYDPEAAKRTLAGLGWKDGDGDGVLEDDRGHPVTFTMNTNSDNKIRVALLNFIQDDLRKVGIRLVAQPIDFNTLITHLRQDFQYQSILLGLGSAVPSDPGMGQNVFRSSGVTHYWNIKQPQPETPAEARIDRLMDENVRTQDMDVRRRAWAEIEDLMNEECFVIWLPTQRVKIPVRNGFGNLQPTLIPHRLLWNIDRVFVKTPRRRT